MKRLGKATAAAGLATALALAGCSGQSLEGNGDKAEGTVTLKVAFWGDMGLDKLKAEYEAAHPNVKIVLNSGEYNAQHEDLQKKIVAGTGAPDISAIDEGFIVQFRSQADKFVNLLDKGGADYESKYLPWKWQASMSPDGKQIGLGTDVGGLAMCYRSDLFKKAGLPTDREAVSKLWTTWDDFINVGKQYVAKTGKKFVDSGTNMFNPVLAQQPVGFFDPSEKLVMDGGPKVAFDVSMKAIDAGLSANLASFQPNWDQGFKKDQFAVLACPAWMIGHIQDTAPDQEGKWDIAVDPRRRRQLGRLVVDHPVAGQEHRRRGGLREVDGRARAADRGLQDGRQPAVAARALQGPGGARLQEGVHEQRARPARSSRPPRRT
jgi:cellobiose transport system substrate-binding protein